MSELPAPHTWKAPATVHDSLCRQQHWEGGDCFDCRLIAKVRADEMEKAYADVIPRVRMAHAQLRAKVEALTPIGVVYPHGLDVLVPRTLIDRADVLALLDGNGDEG